jgi:tetratricopeptide (TPR) repeat protein
MTTAQPVAAPGWRRGIKLGIAAVLVAGGAAGIWWWSQPAPPTPPMPAGIEDAEVRQAIEDTRQRVLNAPRSAAAWGDLGLVLLAHRLDDDAALCFMEAARLDPADPRWPYGAGLVVMKSDVDRSLSWFRQAVKSADNKPEFRSSMRLRLAETLVQGGHLDEAAQVFQEEEQDEPQSPRLALGKGQVALARDDTVAATKFLLVARANSLARKRATVQLAAAARRCGDGAAADAYELDIAQWPDDPPWPDPFLDQMARVVVGRTARQRQIAQLERQHRFADVADIYLQLIQTQPTPTAYLGAGTNLARAGDYRRGLPLLHEAIRLDPDSANAHTALAAIVLSRAQKEWQTSPEAPRVKEWFREVVEHARRATELRPDHGNAYLCWGLALKYLDAPAAAIVPLRKGVACQPANLALQQALGEALLEAGEYTEARAALENARLLAPKDARTAKALERLSQAKE